MNDTTLRLMVLLALVVGFGIGLAMGGLAQRELDRVLRKIAVRRAVNAAWLEFEREVTCVRCDRPVQPEVVGGDRR